MNKTPDAYPLQWPAGRPRAKSHDYSRFDTTFARVRDGLCNELERLDAGLPVLSTNVKLKINGLPYANEPEPQDPGVAVYFTYKEQQMCFACDRWNKVKDNMQAVKKTIEALRGIARWGTGDMLQAAFTGFKAFPEARAWREILNVNPDNLHDLKLAYRKKAKINHPDMGGSHELMSEINKAYEDGMKELLL